MKIGFGQGSWFLLLCQCFLSMCFPLDVFPQAKVLFYALLHDFEKSH